MGAVLGIAAFLCGGFTLLLGCLNDTLPHCARESEVAIGARELLRQLRLALYYRAFYNMTPELAGSGAVGAPVGEAGEAGVCTIAAL